MRVVHLAFVQVGRVKAITGANHGNVQKAFSMLQLNGRGGTRSHSRDYDTIQVRYNAGFNRFLQV